MIFPTVTISSSGCTPETSLLSPCSDPNPAPQDSSLFVFDFYTCSTPVIEQITPTEGDSTTKILIQGKGFGSDVCQHTVMINDHECTPTDVSPTLIKCDIVTAGTLPVNIPQVVSVKVNNRGFAMNDGTDIAEHFFTLLPRITSVSPVEGSKAGGTRLTIAGDGFDPTTSVISIGGAVCVVESVTYTEIICITSAVSAPGTYPVSLKVNNAVVGCPSGCNFNYNEAISPNVDGVSPTIVSGSSTAITITGTQFTTDTSKVTVTIGGVACAVSSASATEIVCSVGYVPVGDAALVVNISQVGDSTFTDASHKTLWSSKDIFSVTPNIGSRNGGQEVTIAGNGFHLTGTTVTIKDKECVITSITISEIKCTTPSGSRGSHPLQVTSGIHAFTEQTYEYSNDYTLSISSVTPAFGKSGDTITIAGQTFSNTMQDVTVTIDGVACAVTSASESSIECTVGAHSAGTFPILVHVKGKGNSGTSALFEYSLSIDTTSPDSSKCYLI